MVVAVVVVVVFVVIVVVIVFVVIVFPLSLLYPKCSSSIPALLLFLCFTLFLHFFKLFLPHFQSEHGSAHLLYSDLELKI